MKRQYSGFTLIEVLVVVAIIALLISILLPSLRAAREASKSSACLSQQHQIGVSVSVYAHDNKGLLPRQYASWIEWLPAPTHKSFSKTLGNATSVFYCPNDELAPQGAELWRNPTAEFANHVTDSGRTETLYMHEIGYYYLGNPTYPGSGDPDKLWVDVNRNGKTRDEYVIRIDEKTGLEVVILSCRVPQGPREEWLLKHPKDDKRGYSNVLFGDAHAERRPYHKVKVRWNSHRPVGW